MGERVREYKNPSRSTFELYSSTHRTKLQTMMASRHEFSVWNIFKHFVGKDLTKITMPVILNEPISFEQRLCEYFEYSELLDRAAQCDDQLERFEWVLAFTIASNSMSDARLQKPFNPILGETYEYACFPRQEEQNGKQASTNPSNGSSRPVNHHEAASPESSESEMFHSASDSDSPAKSATNGSSTHSRGADSIFRGFRYVSEQVSHHPPVSAFYAEQAVRAEEADRGVKPGWTLTGAVEPKAKFWGKYMEIEPRGTSTLTLSRYNETYTWTNPCFFVHNILLGFGRIWVEIQGEAELRCVQSDWYARVHYEKATGGFFDTKPRADRLHRVNSTIHDGQDKCRSAIYGKWTEAVYAISLDEFEKLESHGSGRRSSDTEAGLFDFQIPGQRRLWAVSSRPRDSASYYNFTEFCLQLNDPDWPAWFATVLPTYRRPQESAKSATDKGVVAPTDSRWRGDMRLMETRGDLELAGAEKQRIEEKQRDARRHRGKKEYTPLWFRALSNEESDVPSPSRHSHGHGHGHGRKKSANASSSGSDVDWIFTHEYWQRDWSRCPDIF